MKCDHCCMSCEPGKGDHMSMKVFKKAIQFCEHIGSHITIGGGEPTVHPRFEEIFLKVLMSGIKSGAGSYIITNGKHTERALMIAHLAKGFDNEMFGAELSQDYYHEPISDKVIKAFGPNIRNTSNHIMKAGRADEEGIWDDEEGCVCSDIIIKPDGTVMSCGCDRGIPLGNVLNPKSVAGLTDHGYCTKDLFPYGKVETVCPNCGSEGLMISYLNDPVEYDCKVCKESVTFDYENLEVEVSA